ncbi:MAG: hypothetical protein ABSD75_10030 [Terriglobales bacterium]
MLPLNWHQLLTLFLWTAPHAFLGVLVVVFYKRRLYREFPCFFAYVLYEMAEFILLSVLLIARQRVTDEQYMYAYYATLMVSVALRFGVIDEVAGHLFRESPFLKVAARRALQLITVLLLAIGVVLAVYAPGDNSIRWVAGMSVINRGAAMIQSGLLLCLLLSSRYLGLSWRRPALGITLGLGILTSVDLAIYAVRAGLSSNAWGLYLDLLRTSTYFVCISIWIGGFLAPEPEPASIAVIPHDVIPHDEVETWNKEFRHLLRH